MAEKVVVTERALREMVREAMWNKAFTGWSANAEGPASVNSITDPSAPVTEPVNPNFTPQSKVEFGVAVNQLVKNLPDTEMPELFTTVKTAIDDQQKEKDEEAMTNKAARGGTNQVEEAVRQAVRSMLAEMRPVREAKPDPWKDAPAPTNPNNVVPRKIPSGEHGGEWNRRAEKDQKDLKSWIKDPKRTGDAPEPVEVRPDADAEDGTEAPDSASPGEPAKRRAYKDTVLGGMSDVGGASFEQLAAKLSEELKQEALAEMWKEFDELTADWDVDRKVEAEKKIEAILNSGDEAAINDFFEKNVGKKASSAVSGAKRIADEAMSKAQFLATMDEDDLEILVLSAVNDYIQMLKKSGELTPADVQLMKDHPNIVRDLDGFREFLHNTIRRARREDQKLVNPVKDDDAPAVDADGDGEEDATPSSGVKGPVSEPAAVSGEQPTAAAAGLGGKSYKIYPGGRRYGGKPVVTRYKGRVYGPSGETQFKPNDQGVVSAADGDKLSVKKPDSDHTQTWDSVGESVKRPVLRLSLKQRG